MKINELNKEELREVTDLYVKNRDSFVELYSLENFCENYVRKCECCGKFVVLDEFEEDLHLYKNFKGKEYKVCNHCLEEIKEMEMI